MRYDYRTIYCYRQMSVDVRFESLTYLVCRFFLGVPAEFYDRYDDGHSQPTQDEYKHTS